jgi:hypothetical protein
VRTSARVLVDSLDCRSFIAFSRSQQRSSKVFIELLPILKRGFTALQQHPDVGDTSTRRRSKERWGTTWSRPFEIPNYISSKLYPTRPTCPFPSSTSWELYVLAYLWTSMCGPRARFRMTRWMRVEGDRLSFRKRLESRSWFSEEKLS